LWPGWRKPASAPRSRPFSSATGTASGTRRPSAASWKERWGVREVLTTSRARHRQPLVARHRRALFPRRRDNRTSADLPDRAGSGAPPVKRSFRATGSRKDRRRPPVLRRFFVDKPSPRR
jgi:hypothetical protein